MYDSVQSHPAASHDQTPASSAQPAGLGRPKQQNTDKSNTQTKELNWWRHPLVREITWVLVVKFALIFALWWFFFDLPDSQHINASQVGTHLMGPQPAAVHSSEEKLQ